MLWNIKVKYDSPCTQKLVNRVITSRGLNVVFSASLVLLGDSIGTGSDKSLITIPRRCSVIVVDIEVSFDLTRQMNVHSAVE